MRKRLWIRSKALERCRLFIDKFNTLGVGYLYHQGGKARRDGRPKDIVAVQRYGDFRSQQHRKNQYGWQWPGNSHETPEDIFKRPQDISKKNATPARHLILPHLLTAFWPWDSVDP